MNSETERNDQTSPSPQLFPHLGCDLDPSLQLPETHFPFLQNGNGGHHLPTSWEPGRFPGHCEASREAISAKRMMGFFHEILEEKILREGQTYLPPIFYGMFYDS